MTEHQSAEKRRRLAELEAEAAVQDAQSKEHQRKHVERLTSLLIDQIVNEELERLAPQREKITAQLGSLLDHLMAAHVIDPDELDEDPTWELRWLNEDAAIVVVWFEGAAYYEHPTGPLYAERERSGRLEWTIISDDTGLPGTWHREAPPRPRSALN